MQIYKKKICIRNLIFNFEFMKKNIFRTAIEKQDYPFNLNYNSQLMFMGSCFSENIGTKLLDLKFKTVINPFGILYNPISIKRSLEFLIAEKHFEEDNLFFFNDRWHSFYHHGRFSSPQKGETLSKINSSLSHASNKLEKTDYLFITFGTAWVYEHCDHGGVVSNCHKMPSRNFKRRLLNADEITVEYFRLLNSLENLNPNINIIFTLSPIRHLKDGLTGNLISKSILMIAIQQIIERFENTHYFPAYEIMNDDLRDYRFYDSDMLHPNETAVDYIFSYFSSSFFNQKTLEKSIEVEKILKSKKHRPFATETNSHQSFIKNTIENINEFTDKYPEIDFTAEIQYFESLMK